MIARGIGDAHQFAGSALANRSQPDVVAAAFVAVPRHPRGAERISGDARIPLVGRRAGVAERHFRGPVRPVEHLVIGRRESAPRRLPRKMQAAVAIARESGEDVVARLGYDRLRGTPASVRALRVHQAPASAEPLRPHQVERAVTVVSRSEPLQVPGRALDGDDVAPRVTRPVADEDLVVLVPVPDPSQGEGVVSRERHDRVVVLEFVGRDRLDRRNAAQFHFRGQGVQDIRRRQKGRFETKVAVDGLHRDDGVCRSPVVQRHAHGLELGDVREGQLVRVHAP